MTAAHRVIEIGTQTWDGGYLEWAAIPSTPAAITPDSVARAPHGHLAWAIQTTVIGLDDQGAVTGVDVATDTLATGDPATAAAAARDLAESLAIWAR